VNRSPPDEASTSGPPSLRATRQALAARVGVDLPAAEFPRLYAAAADAFLTALLLSAAGGDTGGCALVAVGGYGRGELCPGSDLDVVLVHRRRSGVDAVAQRIWYGIWDDGVSLDHSVRTPREALAVAREDLKVALGLLDWRLVAGDGEVAAQLGAGAGELWTARARRWLPELRSSLAERHRRCGEVPFLLEPDLKESQGGLRDVHALRAAAAAAPVLGALLGDRPLVEPEALLTRCRVALQSAQARPSERLALQDQDRVAATLGFEGADALMAAVAAAGREVSWVSADAWRRVSSWLEGPRSRGSRDRPLAPGIVLRDGE
jgi:[protein-PII] uridylyltransferase